MAMTAATWMAARGLRAASYDVTAISVLLGHLRHLWHLTTSETATLTAAPLVGSVVLWSSSPPAGGFRLISLSRPPWRLSARTTERFSPALCNASFGG